LGCSNTDTIQLNLVPNPTADAGPDTTICSGASVQLNASGGTSYVWSPAGGLSSPFVSNPMAFPVTSTEFTVTVTDNNGCSDTDTLEVNVFSLQIEGDTTICQGDTVEFVLPQGTSFVWDPTIGVGGTSTVALLYPNTSTTYTVTATNTLAGCITNGQITVNVNPSALANFTVDYLPSCDGIAARIFNNSQQADSYIWNFGDGDTNITDFNPVHYYPYGPGGIITLVAIANNGCNDTLTIDSSSIAFSDNYVLDMPNAISPNNDGNNDILVPMDLGWFIDCFTIKVYNRWGQLIFESQRPGQAWDGFTKSGTKAAPGIYYYFVNIKGLEKSGFVEVFY
jgi:gliding motility-associated-like protein